MSTPPPTSWCPSSRAGRARSSRRGTCCRSSCTATSSASLARTPASWPTSWRSTSSYRAAKRGCATGRLCASLSASRNWGCCALLRFNSPPPSHASLSHSPAHARPPARQVGRQSPVLQRRRALQGQAQLESQARVLWLVSTVLGDPTFSVAEKHAPPTRHPPLLLLPISFLVSHSHPSFLYLNVKIHTLWTSYLKGIYIHTTVTGQTSRRAACP